MTGLLDGIRVLDLTRFLAGPFGSMILADMGADVVKVEPPDGDSTRVLPPYFVGDDSAYFLSINRNKRSIVVDLTTSGGQRVLKRLVEHSDVVLDNLRPRQRSRLGVSYEQLRAINPRVVACSLTGFGSDGPYRDRPAYDIVVQALSGVMSLTGEPGSPSVRSGVPIGDLVAGMYLAVGVLGAVVERQRSGVGQHIDVAMLDGQVSFLSYLASYYFVSGVVPGHQGRAHESIPTYNTFEAADGVELVVAANTDEMWKSLCGVLGLDHLVDEERFATNADRLRHRDELVPLLVAAFKARDADAWYEALTAAGVPSAPINTLDRVKRDPQVAHRRMIMDVPHRSDATMQTLGNPVKASRTYSDDYRSPPGLGEHTRQVLAEAGFSPAEIDALAADRHIRADEEATADADQV
jgi:CoA:oxalate CoA-transferase